MLVAGILLVGCGGSTEPEKKTPPPPKVYTAAQLEAALPAVKDIPSGREETSKCPGDKSCPKLKDGAMFSKAFSLDLPSTGAEAEADAAKRFGLDSIHLTVLQNTTATIAATNFAKGRKEDSPYDGAFEEKAVKTEEGYNFGLKGTGTTHDTKVSGWSGYLYERDMVLTNLEGGDEGAVSDSQLRVQQGSVTVSALVASVQGKRSLDECEKIAREVIGDYLARLG